MSNPFSLEGKVALVTGANTGIGQGIAVALAEAGADMVLVGRSEPTDTVSAIKALGRKVVSISADLTDPSLAAGIIRRADALEFGEDDWDAVIGTNLKAPFFLAQAAARHMTGWAAQGGQRGKIINVASMLSFQGGVRVASYTASKSGLAGLTKLLANEWAAKGINVNAIAPGYIATANTAALQADETRNRQILERIPEGRWGSPRDIGGAAVFLASAAADYVQGHILAVDGGWLAR